MGIYTHEWVDYRQRVLHTRINATPGWEDFETSMQELTVMLQSVGHNLPVCHVMTTGSGYRTPAGDNYHYLHRYFSALTPNVQQVIIVRPSQRGLSMLRAYLQTNLHMRVKTIVTADLLEARTLLNAFYEEPSPVSYPA